MTAPCRTSDSPRRESLRSREILKARKSAVQRLALNGGAPVQLVESGPSAPARIASIASRLTIRPVVAISSRALQVSWPWGIIDHAARALRPASTAVRAAVSLPNASAQLVRAKGVLPADGNHRVVLYLHGGAFVTCGANSHGPLVELLSQFADAPVLVVNYRKMPKHSIGKALDDCYDGYRWLRLSGYDPEQIVLAGDSAGGYLAMALAQRLHREDQRPAALVAMSPLLQLARDDRHAHPNAKTDAMFPARAFQALAALAASAAAKNKVDGESEQVYEPLDHIAPGLPPTLIHVSGAEVLLHDAQLAAAKLAAAGVPAEVRIWPGQIHAFQIAASMVPEAIRSLRQIGEYIREIAA
jgi:acetyl esterase/lipase